MELTTATLPGTALTLIHTGRAPTRSALTSQLGVTRATVGALTGELRDLGLIVVDPGPAGGPQVSGQQGRPSHRLLPDPQGPVAVAAQVYPDGFVVALVALGGTVVACRSDDRLVSADPGQALAPVADAAAALLRASGRRCVGAAVAVPTSVTRPEGTAVRALYVGWPDGAPIRDLFAAELARRGVIEPRAAHAGYDSVEAVNDVNARALAEHRHGAGRDATHLLVVSAEHRGVGGALVQHGALYTGSTGLAMETGHVSVDSEGYPCLCGNRGCLCVEADVERFVHQAGYRPAADVLLFDQAVALLRDGYPRRPRVRAAADAIAARLGLGLAGLINVLNPDRVLLGGMYTELLAVAPDPLIAAVERGSPWGNDRGTTVPIRPGTLDNACLVGAAEVAWQPVLDDPAVLRAA